MENIWTANGKTVDIKAKQPRRPIGFRRKRGASMVEMLIAIVVLGVVIISMLSIFVISRTAIYSKEDETAHALALRYLEELEEQQFEDFVVGPINLSAMLNRIDESAGTQYDVAARVTYKDDYHASIMVEVSWSGVMASQKKIDMERFISAAGYKNVGEMLPEI